MRAQNPEIIWLIIILVIISVMIVVICGVMALFVAVLHGHCRGGNVVGEVVW